MGAPLPWLALALTVLALLRLTDAMQTPIVKKVELAGRSVMPAFFGASGGSFRKSSWSTGGLPEAEVVEGALWFADELIFNLVIGGVKYATLAAPENSSAFTQLLRLLQRVVADETGLDKSSVSVEASSRVEETLAVGDKVEVKSEDGNWSQGTVAEINPDGTYTLDWGDGDLGDRVKQNIVQDADIRRLDEVLFRARVLPDAYLQPKDLLSELADLEEMRKAATEALTELPEMTVETAFVANSLQQVPPRLDPGSEAEDRLTFSCDVQNLDYAGLLRDDDGELIAEVKSSLRNNIANLIAEGGVVTADEVKTKLRGLSGSGCTLIATIMPREGIPMDIIQSSLSTASVVAGIPSLLTGLQGMNKYIISELTVANFKPAWVGDGILNGPEIERSEELGKLDRTALLEQVINLESSTERIEAAVNNMAGRSSGTYMAMHSTDDTLSDAQLVAKIQRLEKSLWIMKETIAVYAKKAARKPEDPEVAAAVK